MDGKGKPQSTNGCPLLEVFKDSIRRIKIQKQRPGFDRMAQTLKTHHHVHDLRAIKEQLDEAVRGGQLLTVWTKGLQCYKDPDSLKSLRRFDVVTMADARRAVKQAVREIGDPEGSKVPVIEHYVQHSYNVKATNLSNMVVLALEQLASKNNLICVGDRYKTLCSSNLSSTSKDLLASLESSLEAFDTADSPPPVALANPKEAPPKPPAPSPPKPDHLPKPPVALPKTPITLPKPPPALLDPKTSIALPKPPTPPPKPIHAEPELKDLPPPKRKPGRPPKLKSTLPEAARESVGNKQQIMETPQKLTEPVASRSPKTADKLTKVLENSPKKKNLNAIIVALNPPSPEVPHFSGALFMNEDLDIDGDSTGTTGEEIVSEPMPRIFLSFQCWCCQFFVDNKSDFFKHAKSQQHIQTTDLRSVQCNTGTCCFRSKHHKRLIEHLLKHKCHENEGIEPACLLSFSSISSVIT